MGIRESKVCFLPYEEAAKRVSDEEMQRLRVAFKRCSGVTGFISQQIFAREVLGDGVPTKIAEHIFIAIGGTSKGLTFRDLVCGLVLLTRGTREEKIKFLFGIFSTDGVHVVKDTMESIILACDGGNIPQTVTECFSQCDQLIFEEFSQWIQYFPEVTTLTTWLLVVSNGCPVPLSDNSETPTFYQTLAGATHLLESDIIELEKKYWYLKSASKSGKFDLETFSSFVSPPIPHSVCQGLFKVFDENEDGHIDFREMACGISACCRGSSGERQKFCFKVFDLDGDGFLSRSELEAMMKALLEIKLENSGEKDCSHIREKDVGLMATEVLRDCSKEEVEKIDLDDYRDWIAKHRFSQLFARVLVQVCHMVLGLKPLTREVELQVVRGWLDRENQQELKAGSVWYLVSTQWWKNWKQYVSYQFITRRSSTSAIKRNGVVPNGQAKVIQVSAANPEQTWSLKSSKPRTLSRRESQPAFASTSSVGPANSVMNGHCVSGTPSASTTPGPGPVDNTSLVEPDTRKIMILTGEGGKLKKNIPLSRGRDFEMIPDPVWRALAQWYGGGPALPRTVITPTNGDPTPELELFPVCLRLYRHAPPPTRGGGSITTWTGVGFGLSSFGFGSSNVTHAPPKRYMAYLATFSRMNTLQQVFDYLCARLRIRSEDMRLWTMEDENKLHPLEEDNSTLESLSIKDNHAMLIEVRNRDMSWPEEMSSLAASKSLREKLNDEPTEKGATGLSNLGNTCFMNSALQCLSNTQPLTQYFNGRCHLYELNRTNPLGAKGHLARRYGDLVEDLWSGSSKSLAPLKLRWTIGRYAPRFNGFQQHDSQEFLSFLLDGLHEDLNRVHHKPYVELKDSDGRPDEEVANEAWDNHLKRNKSIVVDLFQGQLRSQVKCLECGYTSVRFDPFTFLSLPLPMDSSIYVEVVVIHLEGTTPSKYGLLLNNDSRYKVLKKELSKLCGLVPTQLLLVEIFGATVKSLPSDSQKIRSALGGNLYAYEVPLPCSDICESDCESPRSPNPERRCEIETETESLQVEQLDANDSSVNGQTVVNENYCDDIKVVEIKDTVFVNGPINRNCNTSENSQQERHLRIEENWFNDNRKKKKPSNPLYRLSPKMKKEISPKFSATFSRGGRLRKSSSSSSSEEMSQGSASSGASTNTDSGISSNTTDRSPSNNRLHVPNQSVGSSRNSSISSIGNHSPSVGPAPYLGHCFNGFVVALHRKMIRMDAYFLSPQKNRPCLFGIPVIVPCTAKTKQLELYDLVWKQVSRLLSPPAPGDTTTNDSDGAYPFKLRAVQKDGITCAWCPWYRFCRGCAIQCSDQEFGCGSSYIVIEWDPTTLHLRYQSSLEKVSTEHQSVEESRRLQTEPIDLYECLRAFTKEEELGEEELWYCNKCKKHRLAVKKLELWRLPPILVIHLKRFQFVNGHWVKSNKIVHYPMKGFDPSAFLVNRSTHSNNVITMVNVKCADEEKRECQLNTDGPEQRLEQLDIQDERSSAVPTPPSTCSTIASSQNSTNSGSRSGSATSSQAELNGPICSRHSSRHSSCTSLSSLNKVSRDCGSSSAFTNSALAEPDAMGDLVSGNVNVRCNRSEGQASSGATCDKVEDKRDEIISASTKSSDSKTPTYKLYSMSCHTGVLGGGHYIAFAHNLNNKWYCYNDSSCKECDATRLQQDTPYMLFYEKEAIVSKKYLPNISGRTPDTVTDDDEYESEIKRLCTIQ